MNTTLIRTSVLLVLISMATWLCIAQGQTKRSSQVAANSSVSDLQLLNLTTQRQSQLHRETSEPHTTSLSNSPGFSFNCQPLGCSGSQISPLSPHYNFSLHVYLTQGGRKMMTTGEGVYPVNTVILKEKLLPILTDLEKHVNDPEAKTTSPAKQFTTELFTGMLKREAGYNPDGGDWEYFVVSGDAKKIVERGKLATCIDCHEDYKKTDYVTREYMPAAK